MVAFIDDHREEYGVEPIGDMPSAEKEEAHYRQITESALAA
jgi:hypothetical protein